MTITGTRRDDPLTNQGVATIRFATLLEDLVRDLNDLTAKEFTAVTVQDNSYTFTLDDANTVVRKTAAGTGQGYKIPAATAVAFVLGTFIEMENESPADLFLTIDDDTLETSIDPTLLAGGTPHSVDGTTTQGTRTIAAKGFARIRLVQVDDGVIWRVTGDQVT